LIIGTVIALFAGLLIAFSYSAIQYGGNPLDSLFGRSEQKSPHAGKRAFEKTSNTYVGIIRGEGFSARYNQPVFYIERAGGQMIEIPKDSITVRESGQE
jgi:hypothetical protein